MSPSSEDLLIQRYVDGELPAAEAAAFAARMLREPALRAQVDAMELLSRGAAADPPASAPPSFTANVLGAIRQLPAREALEQADLASAAVRLCARVLLAAALILGAGLAWHAGLLAPSFSGTLEAAPATIEQEMERLDQQILESLEAPRGGK